MINVQGLGNLEKLGAGPTPDEMARIAAEAGARAAADAAARGAGDARYKQALEAGKPDEVAKIEAQTTAATVGADVYARAVSKIPPARLNLAPWVIVGAVGLGAYLLFRRPSRPAQFERRPR